MLLDPMPPVVHHFDTYPFNWYVIEDAGRLTLIDSGWPGHFPIFQDGLRRIGKSISDVEAILLSHAHMDHVGMAGALSRRHDIPVYIHEDDRAMAASALQLPWYGLISNLWRPHTAFDMVGHAIANGLFSERPLRKTIPLVDGQRLDVPGRPLVLHVPGHTPGETVFFLPEARVLLSGDTLVTEDLRSGVPGGPQFPHASLNGDDAIARRSVDALRDLGEVTVLPGHGKPWHGEIGEAIELARRG